MEEGGWVWGKGRKGGRGFLAGMNSEFLVCPRFFTSRPRCVRGKSFSEDAERRLRRPVLRWPQPSRRWRGQDDESPGVAPSMRPRLRVLALAVASLWVVALILMAPSYSQLGSLILPSPRTSGLGTLRRLEQRPPQQPPPHQPSPLPRPQPPRQPPVFTLSHPSSLLPVPTPRTTACTETGCECAWATADNCKTNDGSVCHKECCCKLTRDVAPPAKATSAVVEAILISPRTRTSR